MVSALQGGRVNPLTESLKKSIYVRWDTGGHLCSKTHEESASSGASRCAPAHAKKWTKGCLSCIRALLPSKSPHAPMLGQPLLHLPLTPIHLENLCSDPGCLPLIPVWPTASPTPCPCFPNSAPPYT